MKYCSHCGKELLDEAVICPNCGYSAARTTESTSANSSSRNKILGTIAKILMLIQTISRGICAFALIIGTIVFNIAAEFAKYAIVNAASEPLPPDTPATTIFAIGSAFLIAAAIGYLASLAWCIPMTVKTWRKLKRHENISTGFKVCTLIFVDLISGILLLCMKEENEQNYQYTDRGL